MSSKQISWTSSGSIEEESSNMLNDGRDENGVFGGETSVRNLSSSRSLLYAASNNGESTERERPSAMKFILARIGFSSLPNFEFIGTAFENAVLLTMKIKELLTSEMLVTHLRTISIPSLEISDVVCVSLMKS